MPTADAIRWFKKQFQNKIESAVAGTPFTVDLLTAIACQETGHIWDTLRRKVVTTDEVLALCVGDTLDADKGRRAFPQTKADLLAIPNGQEMFEIARKALLEMAQFIPGFRGAAANPNKFCHGFGIFQYDLQFFKVDPDFFLQRRYEQFDASLAKAMEELTAKQRRIGLGGKVTLDDLELVAVAIAYNTGNFKLEKGLKQGHFNGTKHYGEAVFDFLHLSRTVRESGGQEVERAEDIATGARGAVFQVSVTTGLNVRRDPFIPAVNVTANVIATLPDGQIVRAVTGVERNGFLEVETKLGGTVLRGFAFAPFLKRVASPDLVGT